MLQIKDVKPKGYAESLYRAETPLAWVHYSELAGRDTVPAALRLCLGQQQSQRSLCLKQSPVCSPLLSLLTARASLQPASSTSTSPATFMAFPRSWQARSSARWWVWRNNRAKALCMLQSAAGGLTPEIPLLRYHQVALKYVFHRSSRIISSVSHCSDVPEDYWHKLSTAWQWQNTSSLQAFGCHITSDSWWFHCTVLSNKIKHKQHA